MRTLFGLLFRTEVVFMLSLVALVVTLVLYAFGVLGMLWPASVGGFLLGLCLNVVVEGG